MKATVQILANSVRSEFPAKDGRKANARHTCQCVVLGDDVQVGVFKAYENEVLEPVLKEIEVDGKKVRVIPPGAYELEYGLGIGWDDKEFKGVLKEMRPAGAGNPFLAALAKLQAPAPTNKL